MSSTTFWLNSQRYANQPTNQAGILIWRLAAKENWYRGRKSDGNLSTCVRSITSSLPVSSNIHFLSRISFLFFKLAVTLLKAEINNLFSRQLNRIVNWSLMRTTSSSKRGIKLTIDLSAKRLKLSPFLLVSASTLISIPIVPLLSNIFNFNQEETRRKFEFLLTRAEQGGDLSIDRSEQNGIWSSVPSPFGVSFFLCVLSF